jgi:hypothetical protein
MRWMTFSENVSLVVGAKDHLEQQRDRGDDERRKQRPAKRVDLDRLDVNRRREQQRRRVDDEHEHEADREREREAKRRDKRREHRVEHGEQHGGDECIEERDDGDARHDQAGHEHGDRCAQPRHDDVEEVEARASRIPERRRDRVGGHQGGQCHAAALRSSPRSEDDAC